MGKIHDAILKKEDAKQPSAKCEAAMRIFGLADRPARSYNAISTTGGIIALMQSMMTML